MIISSDRKLKDYITRRPLELADFIELSIILSEMTHREHQHHTLIGCLSPENISIRSEEKKTAYIAESVDGLAAYQSPEQSGRINRVPDERSDLYVLGIILYELFTGQLPFYPEAGQDWSTVHISRIPLPPISPAGDGPLQNIIMKLLAKSPEDRYQSANGLLADLNRCREMLNSQGFLTLFEIGCLDSIHQLGLSDAWYGRGAAAEQMETGLELAAQGRSVSLWVTGPGGVGKTTLVRRLQLDAARRGGRFVEGSAEPSRQPEPYEPILRAVREWVEQLWSEPADVLMQLKKNLQALFGQEPGGLISFLPEIQPLFRNGAEISAISLHKNGWEPFINRLPDLVRIMAECKPPLVLCIDNLQWADQGTHEVIHSLVRQKVPGLLLIGACRTGAGTSAALSQPSPDYFPPHVLWLVERWRAYPEEQAALLPFTYEDVSRYVSDALHEKSARIRLLARSVYDQTGGCPRKVVLLLESWLNEKRLYFDEKRRQWVWDPDILRQTGSSLEADLQLMKADLTKLSDLTKQLLAMAAAIGSAFRVSILAETCGITPDTAFYSLQEAEAEGIIYCEEMLEYENGQDRIYLFVHESIHQAAYALDAENNPHRHRKIGQWLQRSTQQWNDDAPLTAIDHLNLASPVLSEQEMLQLAGHNVQAGEKALAEGRYAKGREYAEKGLGLLARYPTADTAALSAQLQLVYVWTEYMDGHPERARALLSDLNNNSGWMGRKERSRLWVPLIQFHTFVDNETAVKIGKEALSAYGWKLREKSSLWSVAKEAARTNYMLYRERDKPYRMADPLDEEYAELCLLVELLLIPLLMHDARALLELYARFIRYGLRKGANDSLAVMIGGWELITERLFPGWFQAPPSAERIFLQMARDTKSRNQHLFTFVSGMTKQLNQPSEVSGILHKSMRQGLESGDKDFANAALVTCLVTFHSDLHELKRLLQYFEENMRPFANDMTLELAGTAGQYLLALQDESYTDSFAAIPQPLSDYGESEEQEEDNYSCGCRLEAAYLSAKYHEALYWAKRGRMNELPLDWTRVRKQRFYETLALAAVFFENNEADRKKIRKAVRRQLRKMKSWQGYLGSSSSAYLLMKAEEKRIAGNPVSAVHGYTAAIGRAKAEKNALIEGIACEQLAVCYRDSLISRTGATIALMDAGAAYAEWGITFKAAQIRTRYGDLLHDPVFRQQEELSLEKETKAGSRPVEMSRQNAAEDIRTAQSEIELVHQLVGGAVMREQADWTMALLETAIQQSGAERGLILSCQEHGFVIEADRCINPGVEALSGMYPEGVLCHTVRTGKPLVLHHAVESYWVKDPYIASCRPQSILCMSLEVPGERVSYLLYLENRQLPGVFSDWNAKVLELVATRMIYVKLLEEAGTVSRASTTDRLVNIPLVGTNSDLIELTEPLTEREYEILINIAEGLSNREIAELLGIAETTVKTHVSRIIGKLGVKRRGQAVVRARELGLIA